MIKIRLTVEGQDDSHEVEYPLVTTIQLIKANIIDAIQFDPDGLIEMIDTDNITTIIDNPAKTLTELKIKNGYTIKFSRKKQDVFNDLMQQSDNEKLNQQILHYVHENGQLELQIMQLNKNCNQLSQTLSHKENQIKQFTEKLDVLQQLTNSQQNEVYDLINQISQFEQREMTYVEDLAQLQDKFSFKDDIINSLKIDIEELKQYNIKQEISMMQYLSQKNIMEQQCIELEKSMQIKEKHIQNHKQSNENLQSQVSVLLQENNHKNIQLKQYSTIVEQLKIRSRETQQNDIINQQASEIESLQSEIKEIKLQINAKDQLLTKFSEDKEKLFKMLHLFENEQFQLPDQIQKLNDQLLSLQEQQKLQNIQHEEEVSQFKSQLIQNQLLQDKITQLINENVLMEKTLKNLHLQLQEYRQENLNLENQLLDNCHKLKQTEKQQINLIDLSLPEWTISNINYEIYCLKQGHDGEKIIQICHTCEEFLICKQCVHPIDHMVKPIQEFYSEVQSIKKILGNQWAETKLMFKEIIGTQECLNIKLQSRQQQLAQQLTSCYNKLNFLNNCQYSKITMQKIIQYLLNQNELQTYLKDSTLILNLDLNIIKNLSLETCTKCQQDFQVQSLEMSVNGQEQMKKCRLRCGHDYHADCLKKHLQQNKDKSQFQCICGQKILQQELPKTCGMMIKTHYSTQLECLASNSQYQLNQCQNSQCNFIYIGEESQICGNCSQ